MVELVIDPTLLILDLGILVISSGVISSHIFISHSELINNIKKKIIEIVKNARRWWASVDRTPFNLFGKSLFSFLLYVLTVTFIAP